MPLSIIAYSAFTKLGTMSVTTNVHDDPLNEEDFLAIDYEPKILNISWTDFQTKYQEELILHQRRLLRLHRDYLISKSDWIMSTDVFPTILNKEEWIVYRQALRDLPTNITEYIWKGDNYETLDFKKMNIPQPPPLIRIQSTDTT
jgi:hypothetical protein